MEYTERGMSKFIISNAVSSVISFFFQAVGDDPARKVPDDLFVFRSICIDDQCTVCRKKFCESAEGMTNIINILEEIQMICVDIQDDADLWKEA